MMKKIILRALAVLLVFAILYHVWTGLRRGFEAPWWGAESSSLAFGGSFSGVNTKTGEQVRGYTSNETMTTFKMFSGEKTMIQWAVMTQGKEAGRIKIDDPVTEGRFYRRVIHVGSPDSTYDDFKTLKSITLEINVNAMTAHLEGYEGELELTPKKFILIMLNDANEISGFELVNEVRGNPSLPAEIKTR